MRDATQVLESLGGDSVDINMGCPVKKVTKVGGGSAMMTELDKTSALVAGMVNAVKIPITAKMRLGWDDNNITAPDLARALEEVGVTAIFVHGRTRQQGFSGTVKLGGIRAVASAVNGIPVIGNGDVTTPEAARHMIEETGCDGVGIGRGAFYDPWIFKRTRHYLDTGNLLAEPDFEERVRVLRRHFDLMVEVFGEELGCRMFRKVAPWYSKRFGPSSEFNKKIVHVSTCEDFESVLSHYLRWRERFLDEDGQLQSRYRPPPLMASFMDQEEAGAPAAIPVPKGPVEVW